MAKSRLATCLALAIGCKLMTVEAQSVSPLVLEYPTSLVRERQSVVIEGITETWELRWKARPAPACGPDETSLTCPCTGFAYGEGGSLTLIRVREGKQIDSLDLTALFTGNPGADLKGMAVVQRWAPNYGADVEDSERDDFPQSVARRPAVKVMDLVDYDQDGNRSEFYLKTGTEPCGKNVGVVVGISRSDPKLHVFRTGGNPGNPLVLQKHIWDALGAASGPVEVVDWACADHGSEEESTVRLQWTGAGITGSQRWFSCPRVPEQQPVRENPL